METLAAIYAKQVAAGKFADRGTVHSYIDYYETLLAPYRETAKRVLEIGVYDGGGMVMWREYFHNAEVHGIDISETPLDKVDLRPMMAEPGHNIHIFNAADIVEVEKRFHGRRWDVVIEDASHTLGDSLAMEWNFRDKMAEKSIYIIEDVNQLDENRKHFEDLGAEIIDMRKAKGRFDDVLAVIRKG